MRRGSNNYGEVGMKKAAKQWVENNEEMGVCALSNVSLDLGCWNPDHHDFARSSWDVTFRMI